MKVRTPGGPVKPLTAVTEYPPEEGLRRFTQGELVLAQEMVSILDAAGFYIVERELLDARSWPRQSGLPVVLVNGVPLLFFRASSVLSFMESWVAAADFDPMEMAPMATGGSFA